MEFYEEVEKCANGKIYRYRIYGDEYIGWFRIWSCNTKDYIFKHIRFTKFITAHDFLSRWLRNWR